MPSVLLTAFEPYGPWQTNASWLALIELTRDRPKSPQLTTRLYPVDFAELPGRLSEDLQANYDYVIHLGQAPGSSRLQLEAIGLNIAVGDADRGGSSHLLQTDGPVAYRTTLPLEAWAVQLRDAAIPAEVSFHAGTYLCNAAMYLTHYFCETMALRTQAMFLHVPLDTSQVIHEPRDTPSLPAAITAAGIRLILDQLAEL